MKQEKELLNYNLQMFGEDDSKEAESTQDADEAKKEDVKPKDEQKAKKSEDKKDESVDMQKLMTDYAKLKRAFDKTSSELAETKKSLKEKMTEQEIASAEKAEAEAAEAERVASLERENKIFKATATYLGMDYTEDEAKRMAVAEVDNDFDTRTRIMKEVEARKMKELEAKFYADRPDINAGNGSDVLTKEKFDQMDMVERSKLRASDPDAYERFIGRKQ